MRSLLPLALLAASCAPLPPAPAPCSPPTLSRLRALYSVGRTVYPIAGVACRARLDPGPCLATLGAFRDSLLRAAVAVTVDPSPDTYRAILPDLEGFTLWAVGVSEYLPPESDPYASRDIFRHMLPACR